MVLRVLIPTSDPINLGQPKLEFGYVVVVVVGSLLEKFDVWPRPKLFQASGLQKLPNFCRLQIILKIATYNTKGLFLHLKDMSEEVRKV